MITRTEIEALRLTETAARKSDAEVLAVIDGLIPELCEAMTDAAFVDNLKDYYLPQAGGRVRKAVSAMPAYEYDRMMALDAEQRATVMPVTVTNG